MSAVAVERTRTVTWQDPVALANELRKVSGLVGLRKILSGELSAPPVAALLGILPSAVEEGMVAMALEPAEHLYNPLGAVHGGVIATLCDTVMACAVHSTLPAGTGYTTAELHINFVRPVVAKTGRVTATGRVLHSGGRLATAEARLVDDAGTLYAHATTTCLILRP